MSPLRRTVVHAAEGVRAALAQLSEAVAVESDREALDVAAKMLRAIAMTPTKLALSCDRRATEVAFPPEEAGE